MKRPPPVGGAGTARRRDAVVGEICAVTRRLRGVLPVALQFAALRDDSDMKAKLLELQRLVDEFDASGGRHLPLPDLASTLRNIENSVRDVTTCLDGMRSRP